MPDTIYAEVPSCLRAVLSSSPGLLSSPSLIRLLGREFHSKFQHVESESGLT
ncbi:unnamed protein product [Pylaiella littoralis]